MNNRYYLVRHGQDQDNANAILNGRRDGTLTEIGVGQAGEIAQKIKDANITFDAVLASPLQRVFKTADIICKKLGIARPQKEELLIERDFGIMTGQPISSILEKCMPNVLETEHINYFLHPEGGETFPELMARGRTLLDMLDSKYQDKNVLLATHRDTGKMIYTEYYHQNWEDVLKSFHFGNSELLLLADDSPVEESHVFKIQQHNWTK